MPSEIGEGIVGSYLRHVRGCELVLYNAFTVDQQGEVDVIGIKPADGAGDPQVWLCEVATHIRGLQYGGGEQASRLKIQQKIDRAKSYAGRVFQGHEQRFELWSPYVPVGQMTTWMSEEIERRRDASLEVDFIINERYTDAVSELIAEARANPSITGEDAFRFLQILTRLRGRPDW